MDGQQGLSRQVFLPKDRLAHVLHGGAPGILDGAEVARAVAPVGHVGVVPEDDEGPAIGQGEVDSIVVGEQDLRAVVRHDDLALAMRGVDHTVAPTVEAITVRITREPFASVHRDEHLLGISPGGDLHPLQALPFDEAGERHIGTLAADQADGKAALLLVVVEVDHRLLGGRPASFEEGGLVGRILSSDLRASQHGDVLLMARVDDVGDEIAGRVDAAAALQRRSAVRRLLSEVVVHVDDRADEGEAEAGDDGETGQNESVGHANPPQGLWPCGRGGTDVPAVKSKHPNPRCGRSESAQG